MRWCCIISNCCIWYFRCYGWCTVWACLLLAHCKWKRKKIYEIFFAEKKTLIEWWFSVPNIPVKMPFNWIYCTHRETIKVQTKCRYHVGIYYYIIFRKCIKANNWLESRLCHTYIGPRGLLLFLCVLANAVGFFFCQQSHVLMSNNAISIDSIIFSFHTKVFVAEKKCLASTWATFELKTVKTELKTVSLHHLEGHFQRLNFHWKTLIHNPQQFVIRFILLAPSISFIDTLFEKKIK